MNGLIIMGICVLALAALYLLMILPRVAGGQDMEPFAGWLYAHRGLHDNNTDAPENSLRAFEKAAEAGFGIELDVQMTKDGMPVVFHDFTLKRMCKEEGRVADYTFAELQKFALCGTNQQIPLFENVLKMVDGRVPLIVELKIEKADLSVCREADRLLRAYKGLYCIESFHPMAVAWYRRHRREIVRGQLSDAFLKEGENVGFLFFLLQNLLFNWMGRPDFIAFNCKYPNMLSRKLCRAFRHGCAVAWTVKSAEQLREARKGFDIFIFDSFLPEKLEKF